MNARGALLCEYVLQLPSPRSWISKWNGTDSNTVHGHNKILFFLESGESKIKFSEAKLRLWESQLSGESSERVTAAEGKSDV